jgi:hypothetical protein
MTEAELQRALPALRGIQRSGGDEPMPDAPVAE